MRMGRSTESVRFLDDVDLTFSLDSRSSTSHQMTNIEVSAKPIVFRASYRDINLITAILNKAIERYGHSQESLKQQKETGIEPSRSGPINHPVELAPSSTTGRTRRQPSGKARVLMSKEQV